jgi:Tfp pilus assembly protein PilF
MTRRTGKVALAGIVLISGLGVVSYQTRMPHAMQVKPGPNAGKAVDGLAQLQTERNLGKAYYEQGKYPESIEQFRKVVASGRALPTDHLDLGMALMQDGQLDQALSELTTAKQMDPKLTAAEYNLGILFKRELRYPDAEAALKRVAAADPEDPAVWFNLGTVYFAEAQQAVDPAVKTAALRRALEAHQRVISMGFGRGQNFYVAALFHAFTILTRMREPAEAQKYLKLHEQFKDKVPNISVMNPALEAGKYGAILVPAPRPLEVASNETRGPVTFRDVTARLGTHPPGPRRPPANDAVGRSLKAGEYSLEFARQHIVPAFPGSVVTGDYDGDGRTDLYLVIPDAANHLLRRDAAGTYRDVTAQARVGGPGGSLAAAFIDYDNSGHPSLVLAGLGGLTLYHNDGKGSFADVTEKAGLQGKPGELDTNVVAFDSDADGFLDLLVTVYTDLSQPPGKDTFAFPADFSGATVRLYRNNGDGTFQDVTRASGLGSVRGRWRQALVADFNNDGYADVLLLRDDGKPVLFLNQGEDKFVDATARAGRDLSAEVAVEGAVADFDHDGNFDLVLWNPTGYEVLLNGGDARFKAVSGLPPVPPPTGLFANRGVVADVDGDGFDDLLVNSGHLIRNHAAHFAEVPLAFPSPSPETRVEGAAPGPAILGAWIDAVGKLQVLAADPAGPWRLFEKQGPPPHWLEVRLDGYKSNKQGTGTIVELKAGNFYKKVMAGGGPVRIFTGPLVKLDVVRTTWPNLVVQNALDVPTNQPLEVKESERLASSCPFLYVWNGKRYVFFTDIMGVAPLGELLPDGSRLKPNPEELVRLGDGLRAQDGRYIFQITAEMREADYFDRLRLFAVDHPARQDVYANEIYSSTPVPPALYVVGHKRFPVSAVDDAGRNVWPLIRYADGRYPTAFRTHRILGLADLHALTLDLGAFPQSSHVALWLKGWVFWTDSNASRALMTNSKLEMVPPYLQVRDAHGQWVTAVPDMGLPSGTNRTMRVDLTGKFPTSDHHLRIVTNFCVYWDQIFFSTDETPLPWQATTEVPPSTDGNRRDALRLLELPLASADLHYRGFSAVTTDPQHRRPDRFDYHRLLASAPWNPLLGHYTRYGPVSELLQYDDDRLVVMATGDEITVAFDARRLPPLKPGWRRTFFLYASGYAKDGEPNTAYSRTVAPLPYRSMPGYPPGQPPETDAASYHRYLDQYQTRPGHVLIPGLAPALR